MTTNVIKNYCYFVINLLNFLNCCLFFENLLFVYFKGHTRKSFLLNICKLKKKSIAHDMTNVLIPALGIYVPQCRHQNNKDSSIRADQLETQTKAPVPTAPP